MDEVGVSGGWFVVGKCRCSVSVSRCSVSRCSVSRCSVSRCSE